MPRGFSLLKFFEQKETAYPALLLLSAALFLFGLGSHDLWAPIEPGYAEIARVMFAKREWILPSLNGRLYTDKPILYFWLVLLGATPIGSVNEWTLRLPAALSGVGLVFVVYRLGREFFSPRVGLLAAAILATTARVAWEARMAHTDIPFAFFFTLSMLFFFKAISDRARSGDFIIACALAALATLTKGLIGVVLPGLILAVYAAARREPPAFSARSTAAGALAFLALAAPWFVSVSWATGGQWIADFILTHHVRRYLAAFDHREPWHYYLWNLPLDFLPWTLFAAPALFASRRRLEALKRPECLFLLVWFAAVFVFFSLSQSKRGLYLLPLFPPAAIFIASYFDRLSRDGEAERGLDRVFFNALGLGSLLLPLAIWFFRRDLFWPLLPFALLLAAAGRTGALGIRRRSASWVFVAVACAMLAGVFYISAWSLRYSEHYKSAKPLALAVKRGVPAGAPLYVYGRNPPSFNFYSEREVIPLLRFPAEIERAMARDQKGFLLIEENNLDGVEKKAVLKTIASADIKDAKWHLTTWGE